MLRYFFAVLIMTFSITSSARPPEGIIKQLVNCRYQDRLTEFLVEATMISPTQFNKEAYFTIDGERTILDLVQKKPIAGEKFYIIFGENDSYFSVQIQIFNPKSYVAQSIATVTYEGEKTLMPGSCEFID